jgi:glycerol-3-phosphate dehydrogenase
MVLTLEDLVERRLSALPGGIPVSAETLARVAAAAAPVLGWDTARQEAEVAGAASRLTPVRPGRQIPAS